MAPHPALMSLALYSVPSLQDELAALGFNPGAQGYASLRAKHGEGQSPPTVRTVQKMLHTGELAKWSVCDGIIQLLNVARQAQTLPLLGADAIAGYEYYIEDLLGVFTRIRTQFRVTNDRIRADIAAECGCRVRLLKLMGNYSRTTLTQCEAIKAAMKKLYDVDIRIDNRPQAVQANPKTPPARGRRRKNVKPVPSLFR